MNVRCFASFEEAAFLRDEVDALNQLSERPDPFSTFGFFETFSRHDEYFPAGRGRRLWFLTAFSAGQLIGYLALKQVAHRVMGVQTFTLGLLVTHDTDRPHLVARPEHLRQASEAFYAYLLGRKQDWSLLEFHQQDDTSPLFPPPAAVDLKGYRVRQWPSLENCTIPVRWDSLGAYFKALPKKYRSNLARQMRNLLAAGQVELLSSSDPASTPALFELCLGIEPRSWKVQANANIGRHPARVAFFRSLLDAGQPMRVSIQILLLDGLPIAGIISGAFGAGLYALHIVYDDRVNRFAPGSAMLLMGMRQAIDGHCAFFNLLSGFGYYKARWLAEMTPTRIAQIYRAGSLLFWHRRFGDWKRRLFGSKSSAAPAQFNPARREAGERELDAAESGTAPALPCSAEERERISALMADARAGRCEYLSSAELARVMPMETQRVRGDLAQA